MRPLQRHLTASSLTQFSPDSLRRRLHNSIHSAENSDQTTFAAQFEPVKVNDKPKLETATPTKPLNDDGDRPKPNEARISSGSRTEAARTPSSLEKKDNSTLESLLLTVSLRPHSLQYTAAILRILIRDRHVNPNVRHYRALIIANADPEYGSSEHVRSLLDEMEENGIAVDSGTLHGALQVSHLPIVFSRLTNHPYRKRLFRFTPTTSFVRIFFVNSETYGFL